MLDDIVDDDGSVVHNTSLRDDGHKPFLIKIPAMARSVTDLSLGLRRSTRNRKSSDSIVQPSGSEYSASGSIASDDKNMEDDAEGEDDPDEEPIKEFTTSRGRRTTIRRTYVESDSDGVNLFDNDDDLHIVHRNGTNSKGNQTTKPTRGTKRIVSDDDGEAAIAKTYRTRSKSKKSTNADDHTGASDEELLTTRRTTRLTRKSARQMHEEEGYDDAVGDVDPPSSSDGELDAVHTTPSPEPGAEQDTGLEDTATKGYALRRRKQINYAIPPPLEEMRPAKGPSKPKGKGRAGPGWSATGAELARYMGQVGDDSDSDVPTRTPRKPFNPAAAGGSGLYAAGGGGLFPDLAAAAGTPTNLGKYTADAALADVDPVGVNPNVTFDEVGGLDEHINSLKEMTVLPLLYPELFQRFGLTPPRGVLFHGPPGTGKTLLARALAASSRANGRGVSFFMRKGADCLSKWVGEAERQLRALFDEAKKAQPSIIFFDEIDGLAPVRSSKQEQIHASIVSTLLALMDGMDGRGQVIVIGATNRPDAVDPALRRPGRFDREFYFPLPSLEAREKIIGIQTKKWEGWQDEKSKETIKALAKLTKGYGGADLRALCVEAALNAMKRRYPQIYKSNDRLLLKPETIDVQARDFMISVKNLVPSSSRSAAASALPLPQQLVPLLEEQFEIAKKAVEKALPANKRLSALEEAEYEYDNDDGALEKEIQLQALETLRVYRPRVVLHGPSGMGQSYVGAAILHHLDGYHVQTLDLGTIMGDSTRTPEAAIVQLFVEAKRHHPSIIYVPSLKGWSGAVSESARATVKSMLDSISPNDPVLLLAVVDGAFTELPRDVRAWFGLIRENRVNFTKPSTDKRRKFFEELMKDIRRPPNQFPDGIKRKKRVLEVLPIAPPLEPRKPTVAELALQEENDRKTITLLKYQLGAILAELRRKYKRFTKSVEQEYNLPSDLDPFVLPAMTVTTTEIRTNGVMEVDTAEHVNGIIPIEPALPPEPQLYKVDLEKINLDLYKDRYLTVQDFLNDIGKIVANAEMRAHGDTDRLHKARALYTAAEMNVQALDPYLRQECERMAVRERQRREEAKKAREKANGEANANGVQAPAQPRRSARNNGQQPELGITDPLLLERRLKRQRSHDPNGGDSHGSEEEGNADRTSKRTRVDGDGNDEHDPLDLVGPTSSQIRPAVRFANDVAGDETPTRKSTTPFEFGRMSALTPIAERVESEADVMHDGDVRAPSARRPGGFNPDLLNPVSEPPLPSLQNYMLNASAREQGREGVAQNGMEEDAMGEAVPETSPGIVPLQLPQIANHHLDVPSAPSGSRVRSPTPTHVSGVVPVVPPGLEVGAQRSGTITPVPAVVVPVPEQDTMAVDIAEQPVNPDAQRPPSPMQIELQRTPSPPPPPFHVDETLLAELETSFVDHTGNLSVEQLEQLRALCLGNVWKHRQEWDRDPLVKELFEVVKEFVEEVRIDFDEEE